MSVPCEAQSNLYLTGGYLYAGPFDFGWSVSRGLYTTGSGGGAEHTIQWNGSSWTYTDGLGDGYAGGTNENDPAGEYAGGTSGITVTVTSSGASCEYSSSSSSSSSSGSAKSSSSVAESEGSP